MLRIYIHSYSYCNWYCSLQLLVHNLQHWIKLKTCVNQKWFFNPDLIFQSVWKCNLCNAYVYSDQSVCGANPGWERAWGSASAYEAVWHWGHETQHSCARIRWQCTAWQHTHNNITVPLHWSVLYVLWFTETSQQYYLLFVMASCKLIILSK